MVISQFLSLHDVGLFGMGQRVASIIALLVAGLQTALTPLIYYHHAEAGTPVLIARMFRAAWGLLLILALALGLFSVEIVTLIAPPNFAGGAIVVFPLGLSAVFANLYVFAPGPSIARRTWVTALINFAGLTSNALLSLLLTPVFGIVGASVATVTASAALLGAKFYFSQRFYPIPLAWGRICAALGVCVGTFLAGEALGLSAYVSVGFIAIKFLLLGICVLSIIGLLTKMEELRAFVGQVQSSATRGNL
jgi:O-antigen/teichoic acid export membrane protein